nr:type II toxin-antitoxin system VapB family antitoxin [uncultured Arsenicibacter sp.]
MTAVIEINDDLIKETMQLSQIQNPQEVVRLALVELLRKLKKKELAALRGAIDWDGDLNAMRTTVDE